MKIATLLILLCAMLPSISVCAQSKTDASQSVTTPADSSWIKMAVYKNWDMAGLARYMLKEVIPIIGKSDGASAENLPTKLKLIFYIDEQDKVYDVGFVDQDLKASCKEKIKAKLLTMEGWKTPIVNGKPIKSSFQYNINYILWQ